MNYTTFVVGDKEYKLRLNARSIVQLEKKLGGNPLAIFTKVEGGQLPTLAEIIVVLQASLQALEHGFTEDKVYDLYDAYVENGGSLVELIPVIAEVYQTSGLLPKNSDEPGKTE